MPRTTVEKAEPPPSTLRLVPQTAAEAKEEEERLRRLIANLVFAEPVEERPEKKKEAAAREVPIGTTNKTAKKLPSATAETKQEEDLCMFAVDTPEYQSWLESPRPSWATRETWLDEEAWGQIELEAAEAAAWRKVDELDKRPRHQRYRGRTGSPEANWNRPRGPQCWGYKGYGHKYSECPTPRTGLFCYRCGHPGTTWRNCLNCQDGKKPENTGKQYRREYRR